MRHMERKQSGGCDGGVAVAVEAVVLVVVVAVAVVFAVVVVVVVGCDGGGQGGHLGSPPQLPNFHQGTKQGGEEERHLGHDDDQCASIMFVYVFFSPYSLPSWLGCI